MKTGRVFTGPFGMATEVLDENGDMPATVVSCWFLDCPNQSPAWRNYMLATITLAETEGFPTAHLNSPEMTHEVIVYALDPNQKPIPTDKSTWSILRPVNVSEQIELGSDGDAAELSVMLALAVLEGKLPAEPLLSGSREPWHTIVNGTAAHLRGEHDHE